MLRGVPERVAMHLTGHKTRAVFERYNIVSECNLVEAAKKSNALHTTVRLKPDTSLQFQQVFHTDVTTKSHDTVLGFWFRGSWISSTCAWLHLLVPFGSAT